MSAATPPLLDIYKQTTASYLAPDDLMPRGQYVDQTWKGELELPVRHAEEFCEVIKLDAKINSRHCNGALEVVGHDWPVLLPIQLVGRHRLEIFSDHIKTDSRKVELKILAPDEKVNLLHDILRADYVPCVHIRPTDPRKPRMVMFILYLTCGYGDFAGFLPNNPDEVLKVMIDLNPAFDNKPMMPFYDWWKKQE